MPTDAELRDEIRSLIQKLADSEGVEEYEEADGRRIRKVPLARLLEAHDNFDNRANAATGPRTQGVTFTK